MRDATTAMAETGHRAAVPIESLALDAGPRKRGGLGSGGSTRGVSVSAERM